MRSRELKSIFLVLLMFFLYGELDADSLPPKLFALTKEMKGGEKAIVSDDEEIDVDELALSSSNGDEEEVIFANDDDDDDVDVFQIDVMMGCENEWERKRIKLSKTESDIPRQVYSAVGWNTTMS